MIFNKENYNDICKYYASNIIKLGVTEDRLWQITDIRPSEVTLVDVDGFIAYLDLSEDYEVDYPLPGRVVYQCGSQAAFLFRKAAKQYNRGIHNNNTGLQVLGSKWQSIDVSIYRLQQFVDKPSYQDPNNLPEEYASWAVSPIFSLNSSYLFCLNKRIGEVDVSNKKIKLSSPMLKPEVTALFEGWSIK